MNMPTSILIATAFASGCVTTCLIRPEAKEPTITGYYITYEAQLTGGVTKRAAVHWPSYPIKFTTMHDLAGTVVSSDSSVIPGSVIVLNAIPLQ